MTPSNRRIREPTPVHPEPRREEALAQRGWNAPGGRTSEDSPRQTASSRIVSVLRTAAGVVLVAAAAAFVAWTARRHVMTSPRFAVTDIDVLGNQQRTREALVSEAGLALGANIFTLDLDSVRTRLLADPWVAEVTLARRLPGTILLHVTERKAAAIVALGDTYLASAEGEPFKTIEPGDPIDLPVITGVRPEALAEDREGAVHTIRRAVDLAFEYEHGALAKRAPLEEVHVAPDGSFALVVGADGARLLLGGPPFRRKLDQAVRVVAELAKRSAKADVIMLDNDTRPERVVVRVR